MAKTPDALIGIGGAGKKTLYKTLEQDWIVDEAITDDGEMKAFAVDTDTSESKRDSDRVDELQERIDSMKQEGGYGISEQKPDVRYINVVDETSRRYTTGSKLTAEQSVNEIMEQEALNCWWLKNHEDMLTENDSYEGGVFRRRGLSKALYHASQMGQNELNEMLGEVAAGGGEVGIVVGLGGGTGSGMFIDLAKQIRENSAGSTKVTLFGVLPAMNENSNEIANAYAALSEIEYLAVQEDNENPFYNVVLLPIEPAWGSDDEATEDFNEAVSYSIMSYYNISGDPDDWGNRTAYLDESDPSRGQDKFAPFTVAVPQILRYSADDLQDAEEGMNEIKKTLREAQETESALCDSLENYLKTHYPEVYKSTVDAPSTQVDVDLDPGTVLDLHEERIGFVENLVGMDELEPLGYKAHRRIHENFEDVKGEIRLDESEMEGMSDADVNDEERRRIVDNLPDMHDDEGYFKPAGGYDTDQNNEFAELVMTELENIARRRDLLKAKTKIDDDHVREGIEVALSREERGLTTDVDEKLKQVTDENRSVSDLKETYEAFREEAESVYEDRMKAWESDAEGDIENLIEISRNLDEAETLLKELEKHIKNELGAFRRADDPSQLSVDFSFGKFGELNDKLESLGVETVDEGTVIDSLNHIKEAGKAYMGAQSTSTADKLKSFLGSNPNEERKATYFRRVDNVDEDIFEVGGWEAPDFSCRMKDDFVESKMREIQNRRTNLVASVAESLNEHVMNEDVTKEEIAERIGADLEDIEDIQDFGTETNYSQRLRDWLQDTDLSDETSETVLETLCAENGRNNIVHEAFYDAYLSSVDDALEEVSAVIAEYEKEVDKYSDLRDTIDDEGEAFVNDRDDVGDPREIRIEAISGTESSHRRDETAVQRGRLQRVNDIEEAGLWNEDNPKEREKIVKNLNDFARRVATLGDYAPLRNGNIESNREEYEEVEYTHRLFNVYMSRMFDDNRNKATVSEEIASVEETLSSSIRVDKTNDHWTASKVKSGAPWDVSMTTFIGGVFLDNLSIVTDPNQGYKTTYEHEYTGMGDNIVIRHTHGIDGKDRYIRDVTEEDGGWVHRGDVINTRADSQLGLILGSTGDDDTVRRLLDEHIDIEGISSTQNVNWAD
jgi:uncharacterized protein YukE